MSCSGCSERNADSISVYLHQSMEMTPKNVLRINSLSFTYWINHTFSWCHVTVGYYYRPVDPSWTQSIPQTVHSVTTRKITDRRKDLLLAFIDRDMRHKWRLVS